MFAVSPMVSNWSRLQNGPKHIHVRICHCKNRLSGRIEDPLFAKQKITVDLEVFVAKLISWLPQNAKKKFANFIHQASRPETLIIWSIHTITVALRLRDTVDRVSLSG